MNSIRSRLLAFLLATILPLVLISYLVIYFYVSNALRDEFDSNLLSRWQTFAPMAEWDNTADDEPDEAPYTDHGDDPENLVRFEFAELVLPQYQPSPDSEYYQVWDQNEFVYARSPSLQGKNLPLEGRPDSVRLEDITLSDGRRGRVAAGVIAIGLDDGLAAPLEPGKTFYLAVARSMEGLLGTLAVMRLGLVLVGSLALLAMVGFIWFVTRRGLRPLDEMGGELRAIGGENLSRRVDIRGKPVELVPLCTRLNGLLDRLETVLERERRFTSNVAHELRTPIAELRTIAEVSARREHVSEADRLSYQDTTQIASRMERLISTLLELSRCASGQTVKEIKRANLTSLVRHAWEPFRDTANTKRLDVQWDLDETTEINTDPLILGMILSNLFSNAVAYTPDGGTISVVAKERGDALAFELSNTTKALTPVDMEAVFDKFWRKDGPDTGTDNHLGLGLSLVAALSGVLGARVESRMPVEGIFQICIQHPA